MRMLRHPVSRVLGAVSLLIVVATASLGAKDKAAMPAITWAADKPGCSFSRGDDGKYRYVLKRDDLEITIAVDSREVQVIKRRPVPVLGVVAIFHYAGQQSLSVGPDKMTLQFLQHSKIVQDALQPGGLAARLQRDSSELTDQTEHAVRKHPEKKEELEATLRTHLQEMSAMTEFVNSQTLHSDLLTPAKRDGSGWVFFDTSNKWIGSFKKQEDFLLRIPFKDRVFAFPFTLPPTDGDLILRKR
jgi:hypothetical protein